MKERLAGKEQADPRSRVGTAESGRGSILRVDYFLLRIPNKHNSLRRQAIKGPDVNPQLPLHSARLFLPSPAYSCPPAPASSSVPSGSPPEPPRSWCASSKAPSIHPRSRRHSAESPQTRQAARPPTRVEHHTSARRARSLSRTPTPWQPERAHGRGAQLRSRPRSPVGGPTTFTAPLPCCPSATVILHFQSLAAAA